MSSSRTILTVALAGAVAIVVFAGCGDSRPDRVEVSGQVLIDGKPLRLGQIRLIPADARPAFATLDENGRFTLACFDRDDGVVLGRHPVEIGAVEHLSEGEIKWHAPERYADYRTSGLEVEIDGPTENLTIELTWEDRGPSALTN